MEVRVEIIYLRRTARSVSYYSAVSMESAGHAVASTTLESSITRRAYIGTMA